MPSVSIAGFLRPAVVAVALFAVSIRQAVADASGMVICPVKRFKGF